jgi:hypothetical protein
MADFITSDIPAAQEGIKSKSSNYDVRRVALWNVGMLPQHRSESLSTNLDYQTERSG